MALDEKELANLPFKYRIVISIARTLESIINRIFKFSLVVSVMLMGLLLTVPVVTVWFLFVLAYYLPSPLGAIMLWTMVFSFITLAAAVDYVRSA
jgi:hypothetical protein